MTCKDCLHYKMCNYGQIGKLCADFSDKSEWVHLPCKVGDTIFFDTWRHGESIGVQPHKVGKVVVIVSTTRKSGCVGADIPDWAFGKTVFLTREEAKKELEKRRKSNADRY